MIYKLPRISRITKFLTGSDFRIYDLLSHSPCKKWQKVFNGGAAPYPCVCPIRDRFCIKLELYYELQQVVVLYNKQIYFKHALEEFESIDKENNNALISWIKNHEDIGSKLFFTSAITILSNPQNNDKLIVQLNPDEFSTVIQFQEIFNTVYYSEEYQISTNQ